MPPVAVAIRGRRPSRLREQVRSACPRLPGVYGMVDRRGELIYVGKAKCLRSRLLSYFRPKSRDPKAGKILRHTRRLLWEPGFSEFLVQPRLINPLGGPSSQSQLTIFPLSSLTSM